MIQLKLLMVENLFFGATVSERRLILKTVLEWFESLLCMRKTGHWDAGTLH